MKQLVKEFKSNIKRVYPAMEETNVIAVLQMIPDCTCLAMRSQTSEIEGMLEDIMPVEDIPDSENMAAEASNIKPLTYNMIISLFGNISVVHEYLAWAPGTMSSLCKLLDPQQLLLVMRNAVHPLIQLYASPGSFDPPAKLTHKELLDDVTGWFMIQ